MKTALHVYVMLIVACAAVAAQNCAMPGSSSEAQAQQPARSLQSYSASLSIDSGDQLRVEQQAWKLMPRKKGSPTKLALTPPQMYVRCMLAGNGDVLRFGCASGFRPVNPVQTPPTASGFVEDTPNTTGTTLQANTLNTITYDCVRAKVAPHHKTAAKK